MYMKNVKDAETIQLPPVPVYRLSTGDILFVQMITNNPEISQLFNNPTGVTYSTQVRDDASLYLNGYPISDSGYISLPFLGEIHVAGLTLNEAQGRISAQAKTFFLDATVFVKFASFRVTVVGEVRRPGVIRNFNDHLTIFDALAQAGDVTDNAMRSNVLVIRTTPHGRTTHRLNLADKSILASEAFYILPNDIIVVEPKDNKIFQMNLPYISLFLSTISTTILLLRFLIP